MAVISCSYQDIVKNKSEPVLLYVLVSFFYILTYKMFNSTVWNVGKGILMLSLISTAVYGMRPTGISGEGKGRRGGGLMTSGDDY